LSLSSGHLTEIGLKLFKQIALRYYDTTQQTYWRLSHPLRNIRLINACWLQAPTDCPLTSNLD